MEKIEKIIFDWDVFVYRIGFAGEHKRYLLELPDLYRPQQLWFDSKTELNNFVKERKLTDYEVWEDHQIEPLEYVLATFKRCVTSILDKFPGATYEGYLSKGRGFRDKIAVTRPYKGNRDTSHKPKWYNEIREYAIRRFGAVEVSEIEADDSVAVALYERPNQRVAITNDKDLRQITGWHYDWTDPEVAPTWCGPKDALLKFYEQLLTGDPVDNIVGIPKCGPSKAAAILEGASSREDAERRCWDAYRAFYKEVAEEKFLEMGRLVYILRTEEEVENAKRGVYWEPKIALH